jgi:uncharacterized membrane protein YphA (DoxX/SURF4 family)
MTMMMILILVQTTLFLANVNAILLEKFTVNYPLLNERWEKYQNEEGKVYFWSETNKRSQWEDPREEELKVKNAPGGGGGGSGTTIGTNTNSALGNNQQQSQTHEEQEIRERARKHQEDEERRRQTRIAYEEEQQRKLEREQVQRELQSNTGAERILREAEERKREEERRKREENMDVDRMRREKTEAKERAERMERERMERMEYMRKEKERKEQLRKETERKEKERIEMQKREMEKKREERERLLRAAKLVEEEKEREEEKRREAAAKTATTNERQQQQRRENKPNSFSYTTPKTPTENKKSGNDSAQQQKQQQQHAAPNPLPAPEHHDDVNPDHALNIDDHAEAPKRHAPFVDGVVAQFFVMLVTTLSIWLKTMFRKIHEYRLAKQREREENEKEMLGDMGGSGSQIFGSPSRNRNSNGMIMNGASSDASRSNSVFNSPVASNPSANHDLEDQRVKYTGSLKKRQYLSRRASQLRIMLIDVNNAHGIARKWKILGMYFQRLMKSSEIFFLARLFISFYYFNAAAEKYAYYVWRFKYYEFNKEHGFPRGQVDLPIGVPYGALLVVVVTTLMVHDIKPSMCCVYLLFWDMRESIGLTKEVFFGPNGIVFNELAMKKLSVLGSTTLLLVNTIHSRRGLAVQNTDGRDGLLFSKFGNPRTNREGKQSKLKSIALAFARLALASAFLYVGWEQVIRIARNDMDAYSKLKETQSTGGDGGAENEQKQRKDGHDSNWLLVQFILALPLFLGLRTKFVCRFMALSLFLEAFLSWDFWNARTLMPEHARTHFVVNLSCAGGMLLLQMFGAGAYSFDAFLLPKKIV